MGVKVKICGVAHPDDAVAVRELAPDAMGFICWPPSPRHVPGAEVGGWTAGWPGAAPCRVGVYVDQPVDALLAEGAAGGFDVLQLHRIPTANDMAALRASWSGSLWLAVNAEHTERAEVEALRPDAVILDSGNEQQPGGTGQVGRWDLARAWVDALTLPVWLAGGLHPGNVREAIETVRPYGVDVSSGVEATPGRKDLHRVAHFIEQGHRA